MAAITAMLVAAVPAVSTELEIVPGWRVGEGPWVEGWAELYAVTAPSATEVWAVGRATDDQGIQTTALIGRWKPSFERAPSAPAKPEDHVYLRDVAVVGDDVWAVGGISWNNSVTPRIERYSRQDITLPGQVVPSPTPDRSGALRSIAMISARDGWAVGFSRSGGANQPLIAHWNGIAWTEIPNPAAKAAGELNAVAARATDDVWAVGHTTATDSTPQPLILHWNGVTWTSMLIGSGLDGTKLLGVTIAGPGDVWAVGQTPAPDLPSQAIALRWLGDDVSWKIVRPARDTATVFTDVGAVSGSDIWFGGYELIDGRESIHIEHWDGAKLGISPILPTSISINEHVASALSGIAAGQGGPPAAVGWIDTTTSPRRQPVLLRFI